MKRAAADTASLLLLLLLLPALLAPILSSCTIPARPQLSCAERVECPGGADCVAGVCVVAAGEGEGEGEGEGDAGEGEGDAGEGEGEAEGEGDAAPAPSTCAELPPGSGSGVYALDVDGVATQVECDMTTEGGGWALLVRYTEGAACPAPWAPAPRGCRRADGSDASESIVVVAPPYAFNAMRGTVRAFGFGGADAFANSSGDLDSLFVDGLGITVGAPRVHVFSFATPNGDSFNTGPGDPNTCPCNDGTPAPTVVGADYLCEAATVTVDPNSGARVYDEVDVLFDGADINDPGCIGVPESASSFSTSLPAPQSAPVELRLQQTDAASNEDMEVVALELWVR